MAPSENDWKATPPPVAEVRTPENVPSEEHMTARETYNVVSDTLTGVKHP